MMENDQMMERYWLWLCCVNDLSWKQKNVLLRYFGTPENIFRAGPGEFEAFEKTGLNWIRKLYPCRNEEFLEKQRKRMEREQVWFVSRNHERFPEILRQIPDCPYGLFVRGELPDASAVCAAVVGARTNSPYGSLMAQETAGALADAGYRIVSGMACGIDGIAQRTALEHGQKSYSVLGCGTDICYPPENRELYEALPGQGGILTEYPCGTQPVRYHFPERNRIISGLCALVVVVEAREKSGSLITAEYALEQGRDVFAVPGRSRDPLSGGCNRLLANGAGVVLSGSDLIRELELMPYHPSERFDKKKQKESGKRETNDCLLPKKTGPGKITAGLSEKKTCEESLAQAEELVYSNLDLSPVSLNELVVRTGLSVQKVSSVLLELELRSMIAEIGKNQYVRSL